MWSARVGDERLRERRRRGEAPSRPRRGRRRRVVRRRTRELELEQHVGALVLDRLERADRPAELHAGLRVVDGHLEELLGDADLLVREESRGLVERLRERQARPRRLRRAARRARRRSGCARACASDRSSASARRVTPSAFARRREEESSAPGARAATTSRSALAPSTHERLLAVERPADLALARLERDSARVPAPVRLRDRERRERLAARDPGQERRLLRLAARRSGSRSRRARPTRSTARTAARGPSPRARCRARRSRQPCPPYASGMATPGSASSWRELLPDRGLVALGRVHEPPHLADRRLLLEEAPHDPAQLLLLFREAEPHAAIVSRAAGHGKAHLRVRDA